MLIAAVDGHRQGRRRQESLNLAPDRHTILG